MHVPFPGSAADYWTAGPRRWSTGVDHARRVRWLPASTLVRVEGTVFREIPQFKWW